jgi:hypothetical protein
MHRFAAFSPIRQNPDIPARGRQPPVQVPDFIGQTLKTQEIEFRRPADQTAQAGGALRETTQSRSHDPIAQPIK